MPTSLGGGKTVGMRLMVKNGTPVLIRAGTVVSWLSVAANNPVVVFMDQENLADYDPAGAPVGVKVRQLEIPVITVDVAPLDNVTPGGAGRLGVLAADLVPGGFGEIIVYGLARVIYAGVVAIGDVVTAALGAAVDAANAADKNPFGILVDTEPGAIGVYRWTFVNCLGWDGAGTAFGGKAY